MPGQDFFTQKVFRKRLVLWCSLPLFPQSWGWGWKAGGLGLELGGGGGPGPGAGVPAWTWGLGPGLTDREIA